MKKKIKTLCGLALLAQVICSCSNQNTKSNAGDMPNVPHGPDTPIQQATGTTNDMTHKRTLGDIKFSTSLTRAQVEALWGSPDAVRGSGIAYSAYKLKDGKELWFQFFPKHPYQLLAALIYSPETGEHMQVFDSQK